MFQPVTKTRHSGMDAGIQSQGCETMSGIEPCSALAESVSYHPLRLRSGQAMALDTGIHAGMTVLAEVPC